jgi:hypothetical protein
MVVDFTTTDDDDDDNDNDDKDGKDNGDAIDQDSSPIEGGGVEPLEDCFRPVESLYECRYIRKYR